MSNMETAENEKIVIHRKRIQQMSPAEKYALFTEIRFLLAQNRAKIQYLDVSGFPLLRQIITGGGKKAKKQIIKNSQFLQEKMYELLMQLDSEIMALNIRQIKTVKKADDAFHMAFDSLLFNIDLIERNQLDYDEELYSRLIADVEQAERRMIEEINEALPQSVSGFRILRLIPHQRAILTENGVECVQLEPEKNKENSHNLISQGSLLAADTLGPYDAVVMPHNAPMIGIQAEHILDFNDYQMLHYMHVRKPSAGQQIAMIDYYDRVSCVSGYIVGKDGTYQRVFRNKEIKWGKLPSTVKKIIKEFFEESGTNPENLRYAKSYTVLANIENIFGKIEIDTFELDEQWLCSEAELIQKLLANKE